MLFELAHRDDAAVADLLSPLDDVKRHELVTSMGRIRHVLGGEQDRPARRPTVTLRAPGPGDLGWVVERHGTRYAADYGWDATFAALVMRIVADFAGRRDTGSEAAWIAEIDGDRVGSVFCTAADDAGTAQLRLLLVEPSARGHGVGTRLVDECVGFARRSGYSRITLWTNEILRDVRRIYARAGFRLDRSEPYVGYGHNLVGEYWSREF